MHGMMTSQQNCQRRRSLSQPAPQECRHSHFNTGSEKQLVSLVRSESLDSAVRECYPHEHNPTHSPDLLHPRVRAIIIETASMKVNLLISCIFIAVLCDVSFIAH